MLNKLEKNFFVRGKVHGIQEVRGLKFMRENLVNELREISNKKYKKPPK